MKASKILVAGLALLSAVISTTALATDDTITKTASPGSMLVLSNGGVSLSQFGLTSSDFPSGTGTKTKTLTGIDWQTTWYPEAIGETLELCYFRPYSSTEVGCRPIPPNSSGTINDFNNQRFGNGAKVIIYHRAEDGSRVLQPAGQDTVTYHYSY
ncbi:hypothetical protein ACFQH5_01810 [Halomonas salifodinae]|uniref:Uncharacterized protein n=1 Tax=Halomonas salifodinae TaxID=438745 RepID=A0ABW2EUE0_9GAMM